MQPAVPFLLPNPGVQDLTVQPDAVEPYDALDSAAPRDPE